MAGDARLCCQTDVVAQEGSCVRVVADVAVFVVAAAALEDVLHALPVNPSVQHQLWKLQPHARSVHALLIRWSGLRRRCASVITS